MLAYPKGNALEFLTRRQRPHGEPRKEVYCVGNCPVLSGGGRNGERMARKVFFSFHYERDAQRAAVVRNHAVTKDGDDEAGYVDKAAWESIEKGGEAAIKKWIAEQLKGTSVSVVLIGPETSTRKWVKYELQESYARGNGLLGVTLHNIKDFNGKTDTAGSTSFGLLGKDKNGSDVYFASVAKTYDWISNNGYENFGKWVEEAATAASKR